MSRPLALIVYLTMAAFFGCFFAWPIWTTVRLAFEAPDHSFTLEFVGEVFMNPLYREGLLNSFSIAVWTTLGCLVLSVPLALLFVRYDFTGKTLLNSLVLTPMVLPPFVGAIGIKAILGQAGALNALLMNLGLMSRSQPVDWLGEGQMTGIVIMEVLHLYPILYLNVAAALANLDPAMEEAAANLGCPPWRRFWKVTLPLIMPGMFAGGTLVFIWAFTELGVPLVFDFDRVTSVQIFRSLNDLSDNPFPYALVVVLLLFSTLIYGSSKLLFGGANAVGGGRATTAREVIRLRFLPGLGCAAVFALVTFLAVVPHLGVALLSVADDWYGTVLPRVLTLDHFHDALGHELTLGSIANSLKYSVAAIFIALLLGIGVAYINVRTRLWGRQLLDVMAMLPLAVPGVVMAFGYLAMTRPGREFDWLIPGENPLLILIIAYAVRRLPYIVRSASAGFQQVSPSLEEAAQNLGARPERALWRVTLPLVAPNLLAGGLLAFAFAMLEVSDSMILAQQAVHYPITKAIYSLVMALGNGPNLASALGVWAMIFLTVTIAGASLVLGKKLGALFR
ncbi:MAG TPA: iron ABC transporter permease [Prosthecobacter sp.]|nr:iron ABC transporter permease [Prosthecobacter sp.]HRK16736.1 iron ABC transporter permease [Prosthecobacter sp.]